LPHEDRTVLVSGMIAAVPRLGGATWAVLQYVLGLRRLGMQVFFVESIPPTALLPEGALLCASDNARYFQSVMRSFGLEEHSALLLDGSEETVGLALEDVRAISRSADVLLNLSGLLVREELVSRIPVRVYVDLDPAFTQLWYSVQGLEMRFGSHTHFVTVAESLGQPECPVPTCGIDWIATRPPVVLDEWPALSTPGAAFTTIANWRGYGSIEHQGVFYGQKVHSLRPLLALPDRTGERFVLALSIHPDERADLRALDRHHWELVDPAVVAGSPDSYRSFVQESHAEFGIAKSGYVLSRCGWFSDRSACYLASGRPVIAQDTGFTSFIECGEGLLPFRTEEDAIAAVAAVQRDYPRHAAAARRIAEEYFDSDQVLGRLLAQVLS
jgi:hypothetical protein